ncbi:MAG: hypothetical protein O6952_04495 [Planctomycetota bacterium]|nr:hypothetical protein [Planctomycetota bacterium]
MKDPTDFLRLFVEYGSRGNSKMISLQWRCGPKHPSMIGEIHKERLSLNDSGWEELKKARTDPTPWTPEGD